MPLLAGLSKCKFSANTLPRHYLALPIVLFMGAVTGVMSAASVAENHNVDAEVYYHTAAALALVEQNHYLVERKYIGKVSARQHADLGFELGGKIAAIEFDQGQLVQTGDVIAALDVELLGIERQQIEAQLVETRSRLTLNKANLKRQKSLQKSGYTFEQQFDELEAERGSLNATISRLNASVAAIDSKVNKATLTAPFAGFITRRFLDEGAVTGPGNAVVRLQQEGAMEAHIGVPVKVLGALDLGDTYQLVIGDQQLEASLIAIGADVNPVTRTVVVRLQLPSLSPDAGIEVPFTAVNGSMVYLMLQESVNSRGFWVSLDAITDGTRGLWSVFVLKKEADGLYRTEPRDVKVEYATSSSVFIHGGISDGELIVKHGLHRLTPDQLVKIKKSQ